MANRLGITAGKGGAGLAGIGIQRQREEFHHDGAKIDLAVHDQVRRLELVVLFLGSALGHALDQPFRREPDRDFRLEALRERLERDHANRLDLRLQDAVDIHTAVIGLGDLQLCLEGVHRMKAEQGCDPAPGVGIGPQREMGLAVKRRDGDRVRKRQVVLLPDGHGSGFLASLASCGVKRVAQGLAGEQSGKISFAQPMLPVSNLGQQARMQVRCGNLAREQVAGKRLAQHVLSCLQRRGVGFRTAVEALREFLDALADREVADARLAQAVIEILEQGINQFLCQHFRFDAELPHPAQHQGRDQYEALEPAFEVIGDAKMTIGLRRAGRRHDIAIERRDRIFTRREERKSDHRGCSFRLLGYRPNGVPGILGYPPARGRGS